MAQQAVLVSRLERRCLRRYLDVVANVRRWYELRRAIDGSEVDEWHEHVQCVRRGRERPRASLLAATLP